MLWDHEFKGQFKNMFLFKKFKNMFLFYWWKTSVKFSARSHEFDYRPLNNYAKNKFFFKK